MQLPSSQEVWLIKTSDKSSGILIKTVQWVFLKNFILNYCLFKASQLTLLLSSSAGIKSNKSPLAYMIKKSSRPSLSSSLVVKLYPSTIPSKYA